MRLKWTFGSDDSTIAVGPLAAPVQDKALDHCSSSPRSCAETFATFANRASWVFASGYFLVGAVFAGFAYAIGAMAAVFYWFAACFMGLGYAYLRKDARVLGKGPEGKFVRWREVLFLPYLSLVRIFFHIKRQFFPAPAWNEVASGIYLGRMALPSERPAATALVVDLTCEFARPAEKEAKGPAYRSLPALNRFIPNPHCFRELLSELVEYQSPIFVHCGAGYGRAAAFVAALLIARGLAADVDQAERQMRAIRVGVRLHAVQRSLVSCCGISAWNRSRERRESQ